MSEKPENCTEYSAYLVIDCQISQFLYRYQGIVNEFSVKFPIITSYNLGDACQYLKNDSDLRRWRDDLHTYIYEVITKYPEYCVYILKKCISVLKVPETISSGIIMLLLQNGIFTNKMLIDLIRYTDPTLIFFQNDSGFVTHIGHLQNVEKGLES